MFEKGESSKWCLTLPSSFSRFYFQAWSRGTQLKDLSISLTIKKYVYYKWNVWVFWEFHGKPYMDKKKNNVWSIIVKSRPRNHLDRQKKPGSSLDVSLDLTKRGNNLLIKANGLIGNNPSVAYALSDINCSLILKFNGNTYRCFSSESELSSLLNPEFNRNYNSFIEKNTRLSSCFVN